MLSSSFLELFCFEGVDQWTRQRPGLDKLMRSRQVICLWSRCMKGCCEQDLLADDLKSVTQVIEEGDVLDEQAGIVFCWCSEKTLHF